MQRKEKPEDEQLCITVHTKKHSIITPRQTNIYMRFNAHRCILPYITDTGASKSYMSKSYYLRCKSLHDLPKLASKTQRIQVGNGQYVGVLFVIPVIVEINDHRLEVFMLVSEIFDNVDMVFRY